MERIMAKTDSLPPLSKHAATRAQQRGVTEEILGLIWEHADWELPAGNRCRAIRCSRSCQLRLIENGVSAQLFDKVDSIVLIVGPEGIRTVLHDIGRRGKCYRRPYSRRRAARRINSHRWGDKGHEL